MPISEFTDWPVDELSLEESWELLGTQELGRLAYRLVDEVFIEESLEQKREYVLEHQADVLVMGDDWTGKFDYLSDICEVVYLPRTPSVSTTAIIEHISSGMS